MGKDLLNMSTEELWELFPIILKPYSEVYKIWYDEEVSMLYKHVGREAMKRLNHIGSTAVPGLIAKPTVDILLEIDQQLDPDMVTDAIVRAGYMEMHHQEQPYFSRVFNKGYSNSGYADKVFHLHLRYYGDWDELYFRDYLIEHHDVANLYGELKKALLKTYQNNRDGYTEAKSEFGIDYSKEAHRHYKGKYQPKA